MTLPSSGPLTLADIQTEFGGSNPISLGEYYAGGGYVPAGTSGTYGAVPSSGAISIRNFYGTSAILDTQTVTVGYFDYGVSTFALWGYVSGLMGSITDGTFNPKGGATITNLHYNTLGASVVFTLDGNQTNDGWTTMDVAGTTYTRASAAFTTGSESSWTWPSGTNPFGTTVGATKVVTFS